MAGFDSRLELVRLNTYTLTLIGQKSENGKLTLYFGIVLIVGKKCLILTILLSINKLNYFIVECL
ncbi:MAG: hypothetical protein Kow0049_31940 [Stanieria sp.]